MASSPAPRAEGGEPEETAAPWYRWYVLGLLILTLLFSVADRLVFSILIEPIKAEFKLTDTQLGLLGGVAFTVTYMFAGFPAARLADNNSPAKSGDLHLVAESGHATAAPTPTGNPWPIEPPVTGKKSYRLARATCSITFSNSCFTRSMESRSGR